MFLSSAFNDYYSIYWIVVLYIGKLFLIQTANTKIYGPLWLTEVIHRLTHFICGVVIITEVIDEQVFFCLRIDFKDTMMTGVREQLFFHLFLLLDEVVYHSNICTHFICSWFSGHKDINNNPKLYNLLTLIIY